MLLKIYKSALVWKRVWKWRPDRDGKTILALLNDRNEGMLVWVCRDEYYIFWKAAKKPWHYEDINEQRVEKP